MIEEFRLHGPKQTLLWRTESWLRRWSLVFTHAVEGQQVLKVHTLELRPTINGNGCGEPPVALHAQKKDHETRAVTGRIKGKTVCSNAPGMGEGQQWTPTFPQELAASGAANPQGQSPMIWGDPG